MSTENIQEYENVEDTKVGWYLAVSQEASESLRLTNLAYEATDMGGYDEPLENFKVWFIMKLLKDLDKEMKEIQKENKKIAKKEYDIKANEYKKWIEDNIDFTKDLEEQYINLKLNPEVVTKEHINDKVLEESEEYMNLSDKGKEYTITTAISLINKFREQKNVINEVDGGKFSYDWFPIELMHPYASGDVDVCRRIYCEVLRKLEKQDRPKALGLLKEDYPRLTRTLARIQSNGFHTDLDYMEKNDEAYRKEMEKTHDKMREHWAVVEFEEIRYNLFEKGLEEFENKPPKDRDKELAEYRTKFKDGGWKFSPSSGEHKGEILYDILGISLPYDKQYVKDKPFNANIPESELTWKDYRTNKDAIDYALDKEENESTKELLELMQYYATLQTKRTGFTYKLPRIINKETGNLHPGYNITGTECVSGDTLLITDKGIKEIQKLSENRKDKTFSDLNIKVPNHNGGFSKSSAFYYSGVGKSLKIKLENGMNIITSYNHPLRKNRYYVNGKGVQNNNQKSKHFNTLEWVQASNISKGDYLQISLGTNLYGDIVDLDYENEYAYKKVTNSKEYTLPKVLTPELAEFIGIFMADGNIKYGNGTKTIVISNKDIEVLNRVEYIVKKEFNIQCTIGKGRTCYNIEFTSLKVVTWFEDILGMSTGSLNKTVPEVVLNSTKENQQHFIKGLSLDSSTKKKEYPSIYFSSVSKDLANKLSVMLMNMGIYTRMSVTKDDRKDTYNTLYTNQITYENVKKYMNEIGFIQDRKVKDIENKLQAFKGKIGKNKGMISDGNIFLAKVEDIVYNGEIPLFDLHVPNEHSFIGNGLVNHNTSRLSSSNPRV